MAELGDPPQRHWVLIVSLDARNASDRIDSVLVAPFGSTGIEGPTSLKFEPGETGLPGVSYLKGHFITTLRESRLKSRHPRALGSTCMKEVAAMIRRAFDPDSPWGFPPPPC